MADSLEGYEPREWNTYVLSTLEGQSLPTEPTGNEYLMCAVDSTVANHLAEQDSYDPKKMFFYDFEQLCAGHNVYGCGPLIRLINEYKGHPAGKLAFVSFEGMENDPPTYLLYVEK